jgi:hypothetical protein
VRLGPFALGHVVHEALDQGRPSGLVALDDDGLLADPDHLSARLQVPVLDAEGLARPVRSIGRLHDAFTVVGVDPLDPQAWVGAPLGDREAQDGLDLRAHVRRRKRAGRLARVPGVGDGRHLLDEQPEAVLRLVARRGLAANGPPLQQGERAQPHQSSDQADDQLVQVTSMMATDPAVRTLE